MDATALLTDAFTRVNGEVHSALRGIKKRHLNRRARPGSTNRVMLVLTAPHPVQDDHVADAAGNSRSAHAQGFEERFGCPSPAVTPVSVTRPRTWPPVRVELAEAAAEYHDAVHEQTLNYLGTLMPAR